MAKREKLLRGGIGVMAAEMIVGEVQSLALAGSTITDATKVTGECVLIASGTGGLVLPAGNKGDQILIKNESGNTATLYGPSGGTINATAAATGISMATAKSCIVFYSGPTTVHTIPTVPS